MSRGLYVWHTHMHVCVYGCVCVLESGECWNRLARMVSLQESPLFGPIPELQLVWGRLKFPQCSEGGGPYSSAGGARSGSSLGLLSVHLPNPGGEDLICLGFSVA